MQADANVVPKHIHTYTHSYKHTHTHAIHTHTHTHTILQADANVVPKRMLAHCSDIYRDGGVKGFWMGTSTTVARAVVLGATKLATYDEAKLLGKKYFGLQGKVGLFWRCIRSLLAPRSWLLMTRQNCWGRNTLGFNVK
jgi:hypothetical protein